MSDSTETVIYRQQDYAHGIRRLIAVVIDVFVSILLLAIVVSIASKIWVKPEHINEKDVAKRQRLMYEDMGPTVVTVTYVLGISLIVVYQIGMRRLRGGTIGYRIARIRLIGHDGNPPTWKQLMIRIGLMIAGIFTLGLVFLPAFLRKKRQALHDQLATTWMVRAKAMPEGPGQLVYKTKLFGTFPVTMTDIEPAHDATEGDSSGEEVESGEGAGADVALEGG